MQDRFKFRIFINNKIQEVFYFYKSKNGVIFACTDLEDDTGFNIDGSTLMQCTGLKDKNGKLIYEGDIVRYAEYDIEDIEPEWEYDEIMFGDKYSYPAFDLKNGNLFDCNGLSYIFNEGWTIEVIGNIYENAELLEKQ